MSRLMTRAATSRPSQSPVPEINGIQVKMEFRRRVVRPVMSANVGTVGAFDWTVAVLRYDLQQQHHIAEQSTRCSLSLKNHKQNIIRRAISDFMFVFLVPALGCSKRSSVPFAL